MIIRVNKFSFSLSSELLYQLLGPFASVSQELRTIRGEIAELTNEFVTLSNCMNSAELTLDDIRLPLDVLKYSSVCLFQEEDARLECLPFRAINR